MRVKKIARGWRMPGHLNDLAGVGAILPDEGAPDSVRSFDQGMTCEGCMKLVTMKGSELRLKRRCQAGIGQGWKVADGSSWHLH